MSADIISVQSGSDSIMVEDNQILQYDFDNLNISFNGCGFLGVYHVGVASALHHYLPNMEFNYVCGASAGAMAGACLVGKIPLGKVIILYYYFSLFYDESVGIISIVHSWSWQQLWKLSYTSVI